MTNIYDMIDTWNDGATTFTAIKMNVTDTASAAGSMLMDLQVGGVSRFSVGKGAGAIFGANLIEQRNSTNAQTFNLYNTYTDASNYERGFMKWNSNVLEIGTEAAGTGTARNLSLQTAGTTRLSINEAGGIALTPTFGQPVTLPPNRVFAFADGSAVGLRIGSYTGGNGVIIGPAAQFHFAPSTAFTGSPDVGIQRSGPNRIKVTNGSTGTGELIFIVPTTDPGITGALWNNAGTLAISA